MASRLALFSVLALAALVSSAPLRAQPARAGGGLAAGIEAARVTDYPKAERELAAVRGADQPAAQLALARVFFEQGRFAEAERAASQAGGSAAERVLGTTLKARVLAALGKKKDAIALLAPLKTVKGREGRAACLLLGELLIDTGHRQDADEPLLRIIDEYNNDAIKAPDAEGLAMVGRAAFLLRSPKDANRAFNEAERIDKDAVQALLWRAELFLDKYDPGHADEVLREALKVAPNRADAIVLSARLKLDETLDFDEADKLVKKALSIDPKLPAAYAVKAAIALRDLDLAACRDAVAAGLAIDPSDTELLALAAAARFLADDRPGFEAAIQATLAQNPEDARAYEIVADFAEWEHRYADIVTMMKTAVRLDPKDGRAFAQLGLTQLRNGEETEGLESLRKAWSLDHYNVRVFNTLNLFEETIPRDYVSTTENIFSLRYPKAEKRVLERYVPKLLAEAWGSMKARYDFVPTTPVSIELYGSRDQFSVRTSGLPNVGIQGVCFGRVLAAMTPGAEPFNWGNVVWHELGHVFAIQISKSHVPRWFTEGLSEYETIARRPEWQRELDPQLYVAIKAGRLPGSADMNRAFTHAESGEDMTVAYYAASQMLVFTVEQFGMPRVVKALKLWGQGLTTPAVIQQAFGLAPEEYDARYRAWQLGRLTRYTAQFVFDDRPMPLDDAKAKVAAATTDAKAHATYALSLLHAKNLPQAKQEIDEALRLDPGEKSAHYLAVELAVAKKDFAEAEAHAGALKRAGGDGYGLEMALSEIAKAKDDKAGLKSALEAAAAFDPTQSESFKGLYKIAVADKQDGAALDALRKFTRLEQHDRPAWRDLMTRLVSAKLWKEAADAGESAVFVDVENAQIHLDYARALSALQRHDKATFELESALACEPPAKLAATVHALLAAEQLAQRDIAGARRHRDEALKLDPANAEARALAVP